MKPLDALRMAEALRQNTNKVRQWDERITLARAEYRQSTGRTFVAGACSVIEYTHEVGIELYPTAIY